MALLFFMPATTQNAPANLPGRSVFFIQNRRIGTSHGYATRDRQNLTAATQAEQAQASQAEQRQAAGFGHGAHCTSRSQFVTAGLES